MIFDPSGSMQPVVSQLGGEFVGGETIVAWMLGEHAERPAVERAARNLLEQQRSSSVLSGGISFVASVLHAHASMPDDHDDLRKQKLTHRSAKVEVPEFLFGYGLWTAAWWLC